MKFNKWTIGLAAVGVISLPSVAKADETVSFVQTAVSGTTVGGYVDTSIEWRTDSSHNFAVFGLGGSAGIANHSPDSSTSPLGIPFRTDKQNGFNLNAVGVTISKQQDETPWASGFNFQLIYGPDAVGYNPVVNGGSGSGVAIKNANVVLRVPVGNGLDIKVGVFDTIIGYEVFESGNNGNFTRSYGYALEPTQHTGVLFTYRICDYFTISAGVANTLMTGINTRNNSEGTRSYWDKTGMGSLTFIAPQSWGFLGGSTAIVGVVYGFNGIASDAVNVYAGLTVPTAIKGLAFGAAFDYLTYERGYVTSSGVDVFTGKESTEAYAVALYGNWQATEKLSLNVRGEYVHGDYNDVGDDFNDSFDTTTPYENHYQVDVWALTGTLQYNLWANVISRLEARYDEACYKDAGSDSQFSVYLNVIYKF